jgi:hypothetical protein
MEPTGKMTISSLPVGSRSHANPTLKPEKDLEKKMTDTSGRKCLESLKKFNHVGSWAKTFTELLIGMEGWYSMRCRLTWKLRGTKYNRLYCQLVPSTLPIDETGCGLLPTPMSCEGEKNMSCSNQKYVSNMARKGLLPTPRCPTNNGMGYAKNSKKGRLEDRVPDMIEKGLLPTPEANNYKNGHRSETKRIKRKKEQGWTIGLNDQATLGMLPTPKTRDWKEQTQRGEFAPKDSICNMIGKTSQLNPQFVAEMMGFPENWTELPFQNGETNLSKDMETQ